MVLNTSMKDLMVRIFFIFTVILSLAISAHCEDGDFPITPSLNNGQKWRLAYLEGGPYHENVYTLKAVVDALADIGWLEPVSYPINIYTDDCQSFWLYLVNHVKSRYLQFVSDAFWNGDYDKKLRRTLRKRIIRRFNRKGDIDLLIAMGTLAGQDLANDEHSVPTFVFASNDPIASGIVRSAKYSGLEHVHAQVEPNRYKRQIELFHSIFQFKKLGIAHGKGLAGRSYAAVGDIEKAAIKKGFQVVYCYSKDDILDLNEAHQSVVSCYTELSKKVDAIYITAQRGIILDNLPGALKPAFSQKIPTFSQSNFGDVERGVLLSISQASLKNIARFHAQNIAKTFNGAKPGKLNQIFSDPIRVAINFKTLEKLGRKDLFEKIYKILPYVEEYYY